MPTPDLDPPATSSDWPHSLMSAYYYALGEFIHSYSVTESRLLFIVDRYAGGMLANDVNKGTPPTEYWARTRVQMDVIRALVGSQRSAAISDIIKLLMRVGDRPDAERAIADDALAQFAHIRSIRDRLVHTGAEPFYDGKWLFRTSNGLEVRERHKTKVYVFEIEHLEAMKNDLEAIRLRVATAKFLEQPEFREFADDYNAFAPWQYKPIQQVDSKDINERTQKSGHPLPRSPFETAFSIASSFPISNEGPLMYSGPRR